VIARRFAVIVSAALLLVAAAPSAGALETIRTETGLRYADEAAGGGRQARPGDIAIVHYTGWLYELGEKGKQFDTSRNGGPFSFRIGSGRVIKGWDQGVAGMRVGGKRVLIVPSELAYGAAGGGDRIPPNATLYFEVELVDLR
jgi:peptidylprolyl isomerase